MINRKVVITGATRGLGKIISKKLWGSKASLALIARNEDGLKELTDELKPDLREGQIVEYFACDLANLEKVTFLIEDIKSRFGDPDILINNAAVQGPIGPLYENDWGEWQKCLNVSLMAPVSLCRAFIPGMINKNFGKIINISGGGATKARPNFTSYSTAKCGLVRFTETLGEELKDHGIDVNCVAPGAMKSKMISEIIGAGPGKSGENEYETAMKLLNDDDSTLNRAANLVLFLASDKSDGITGKLISAIWDPWIELPEHLEELGKSDVYTLRRILPKDRGMNWGDILI